MSIADKLTTIAENVQRVYDAGYNVGYSEGQASGGGGSGDDLWYYTTKLDYTFQDAEFPADTYVVIKTKKVTTMQQTFQGAKDVVGVTLISDDTTSETYFRQTFRECKSIELLDLTQHSRKLNANMSYWLYNATALKSVLGALDATNCTDTAYAFVACPLEDIEFVPNTIYTDIRFQSEYLSDVSIQSIIDGLADLTGGTAKTLTLNGVGATLTDEQKATVSAKNWTLAY